MLKIENVVKQYAEKLALNGVSFEVPTGSIFGLLGPNGAGKTSLIRIITGITGADSGRVYVNGEPLGPAHIGTIGYLPEERGLYKKNGNTRAGPIFCPTKGAEPYRSQTSH
ncbi:ATP-binding cassette domain-containing protein [Oscillatoria amoena NRMC-F 0135]|nr:ATP-binding cassette domain-containing protein [Oscillatoria amoena NRMC-F 0135]